MKCFLCLCLFFLIGTISPYSFGAGCSVGDAGKQRYNGGIMEYCSGTHWVNMQGTKGSSCVAGDAGKQRFSSGEMQFCDGANWYSMKHAVSSSCTAGDNGKQRLSGTDMEFCNGSNWYKMAAKDPYWSNVVLLIQPLASSSSITDLSLSEHSMSLVGDVGLSTAVTDPWGGSRKIIAFDGSGDYLSLADNDDWFWGTGDVTIEGFFYFSSLGSSSLRGLISQGEDTDNYFQFAVNNLLSNGPTAAFKSGGTYTTLVEKGSDQTSPTNSWVHFAYSRNGSTHRIFWNGALMATNTESAAIPNFAGELLIGTLSSYEFSGYMGSVRITKGVGRYTSAFTPATEAFPSQ